VTAFKARWNGKGWELPSRSEIVCARNYKPGDSVWLTELEESSHESRGHYFAVLRKAFDNLPEAWGDTFTSSEVLRKWCLIRAKYCHTKQIVCDSAREAQRWKAIVVAQLRNLEDYAEVSATKNIVTIVTAESQRMKVMGRRRFQDSKQAVLEILAVMLGVTVEQLNEESKKEAA